MNQSLSPAELEQRFAEINAREPEELTAAAAAALAEAAALDDGSTVPLAPFKAELELPEVEVLDDPVRFEGVSLEGTYVGGEDTVRLEGTVRAGAHTR